MVIFHPIIGKSSQKYQNINNKAFFESPKHQHLTTFETLKYQQQITH
jgi:hypothetical protein